MGRSLLAVAVVATAFITAPPLAAQEEVPSAAAADVGSVDAIIAAVYESISGPAGEPRDWDPIALRAGSSPNPHMG